ncbi:MAG: HD domain-containing protein [Actinobacteria bacterium]|nr:HD domain-containing protein [Actinomycetota bacterium]
MQLTLRSWFAAAGLPTFVLDRPVTFEALAFVVCAHNVDARDGDGAPFIVHPLEAASLLSSCGCRDEMTAAAILHNTPDTGVTVEQMHVRFGSDVARLVGCLIEDDQIADAREREKALRDQVKDADPDVAMIHAADTLSKVRALRSRLRRDPPLAAQRGKHCKLEHYWCSLTMLERAFSNEPLVKQLRFELEAVYDLPPRRIQRAGVSAGLAARFVWRERC